MKLFFAICVAIGMTFPIQFAIAQLTEAPNISANQIRAMQNSKEWTNRFVVVDVRAKVESDVSVIPGAITKSEFEKNSLRHQGKVVIAYCTVGYRSGIYANKLTSKGWRAYNYKGSILDWCKHQLPLTTLDGKKTNRVHTYNSRYKASSGYIAIYE